MYLRVPRMIRILFIDDEENIRSLVRHFLEISGDLQVDTAPSAEDAIGMMNDTDYDAIVCDYEIPGGMTGIEFLIMLRGGGSTVPFLIFTGRGQEEVAIRAINYGADFYIQKGDSPRAQFTDLIQKIGQAVQRRRTEKALRESERNLRTFIESLPDLVLETDSEGNVAAANGAGARIFRLAQDAILKKPWTSLLAPGDMQKARDAFAAMMASGTPLESLPLQLAPARPGWGGMPVTVSGTVLSREAGGFSGARLIVRARDGAGCTDEKFLALSALLPLPVIVTGPDGRVQLWNVGAAHLFGWTEEEVAGKPLPFVPQDMDAAFRDILLRCLQDEEVRNTGLSARRCNGDLTRVMLHAAPLHDGNGGVSSVLLVITGPAA